MRDQPNAGGDRLLGNAPRGGTPAGSVWADTERLNDRQREAVAASVGRDTTFIWGPPGTGKTSTIATVGEALYRQGRSLLLVSHTNVAVDQALLRLASALGDDLREGSVLRVGEPKDLQLAERDDLLLKAQVERRSRELVELRSRLEDEREEIWSTASGLQRLIDIIEWWPGAASASDEWRAEGAELDALEEQTEAAQLRARELRDQEPARQRLRAVAGEARVAELDVEQAQRDLVGAHEVARRGQEVAMELRASVAALEAELVVARRLEPLRRRAAELPDLRVARDAKADSERSLAAAEVAERVAREARDDARGRLEETQHASGLTRRFRGLPKPEEQQLVLAERDLEFAAAASESEQALKLADDAASVRAEVERLQSELAAHTIVRDRSVCESLLTEEGRTAQAAENAARDAAEHVAALQLSIRDATQRADRFRQEHGDPSDAIYAFKARIKTNLKAPRRSSWTWRRGSSSCGRG